MKTIQVSGREIRVEHEVVSDEKTHHVTIHVKLSHESGKQISHVMTIGAVDSPLPVGYDKAALQKDLDAFKQKHAELFESKLRAAELAAGLEG